MIDTNVIPGQGKDIVPCSACLNDLRTHMRLFLWTSEHASTTKLQNESSGNWCLIKNRAESVCEGFL